MMPSSFSRGFSLIELMCSMLIGSILLLAAAALLGSAGDGYERVGGSVSAEREARALITQLTSDLSTARFHKDGVMKKSSTSWPADTLGFLSLQPEQAQTDEGRIGDLCAVNYALRDLTIKGRTVRCLMRGFRESKDTFKALENDKVASLFTARPDHDEPVAFGVVSFEATPKSLDESGKWIDWVKDDKIGPQALDVRLVIARRNLAVQLKQPVDWDGGGKLLGEPTQAELNKNLEVYGTLIRYGNDENP